MPDRGKKPRSVLSGALERKEVRAAVEPADVKARKPTWAFRIVDLGGPWCWSTMPGDDVWKVLKKLGSFETMTWREIDGPAGCHGVPLSNLIPQAQRRLVAIGQDDVDELFSLRITGARRVWGILDGHVYRILWWDPKHQVCASLKD